MDKPITVYKAKKIIKEFLDKNNVEYSKLTGRTVDFTDLARVHKIFVKIHGWKPNPIMKNIKEVAYKNGFCVETDSMFG